jgi:SAM-dependent methyltransferase
MNSPIVEGGGGGNGRREGERRPRGARGARGLQLFAFGEIAFTVLALQIVLSRLIASTMSYYFAFLLVSLAMLGLGSGALLVQLAPRRFAPDPADPADHCGGQAAWWSLAMALCCLAGTLALLAIYPRLGLAGTASARERPWLLAALFACLFPTFLCGGIVVAVVFAAFRARFHRVYAVDLGAAALGCLAAVGLLSGLTPVEVLLKVLVVLPATAAGLFALGGGRPRLAALCLGAAVLLLAAGQGLAAVRRIARPPHLATMSRPELLSEWNSFSSVRVFVDRFRTWALSPAYRGRRFPMLDLLIDGIGGTQIVRFDGDPRSLAAYDYLDDDLTALGQQLVPAAGRELIIGPGGGVDVLQAVRRGRRDVTLVEINPLVVRVVNEDLAPFSGSPYRLPGVRTFVENGRTFILRTSQRWDLIDLTWVDFGGSATALAFSENYLYTVEAYRELLRHLRPGGCFAFLRALGYGEIVVSDSMRGIAVATEALRREGVADPGRQLLVAGAISPFHPRPMCYVLVKRSPFTAAETARARGFLRRLAFVPIWMPDGGPAPEEIPEPFSLFAGVIRATITDTGQDLERLYRDAPYDIAPATDDNPFYFAQRGGPHRGAGPAVLDLEASVALLVALLVPFVLLPLAPLARRMQPLGGGGWAALAYFSAIGAGYILVEIDLFHLLSVALGNPTYTFATVLATLLLATGAGSLAGRRLAAAGPAALALAFIALVGGLLGMLLARSWLLAALIGQPLPLRVVGTAALIAPLGVLMGLPMATGVGLIGARRDLMLWGWALNASFSVLASVAAVYLAIEKGISFAFLLGAACYLAAGLLAQELWRRRAAWALPPDGERRLAQQPTAPAAQARGWKRS